MPDPNQPAVPAARHGHVAVVTLDRPEVRDACNQASWIAPTDPAQAAGGPAGIVPHHHNIAKPLAEQRAPPWQAR